MLQITFISDYVCPYCLVAKEALKQALEETGLFAEITWQPYELTPESRKQVDTWHDETRRAKYRILEEPCAQLGLPMKLPPKVVPRPYTRLAFEGWYYACDHGQGEHYNDLVYRAYFLEERDIGRMDVLTELARQAGLDGADFAAALERGDYTRREQEAVAYAREVLRPCGVPTIYINGEELTLQTYTKEEMVRLLQEGPEAGAAPGFSCGPDGCSMG